MNNKILTFVAGGLIALSASIGVGGALTATVGQNEAVEAEATTSNISFNIGLKTSYYNTLSNIYLHHWVDDGSGTTWPGDSIKSDFKVCEYDSTYMIARVSFTSEHTKFIINNSSTQSGNVETWYVTDDMKANFGNAVAFLDFGTSWENGAWGVHTRIEDSTYGPNEDNFRVWMKRSSYYNENYRYTFHYWGTDSEGNAIDKEYYRSDLINYTTYEGGADNYLVAYDIPKEAIGCQYQFKLYEEAESMTNRYDCTMATSSLWEYQASAALTTPTYKDGYNSYVHFVYNEADEVHMGRVDNTGILSYSNIVKDIFESYYTCSNDPNDGYGDAQTFYDTWFGHLTDPSTSLDIKISDYADESAYSTGTKSAETTAWNKVSKMLAMQQADENAASSAINRVVDGFGTETAIATVAVLGSITLMGLAAFYYRRKRAR